jgi:hypothetical protein
VPAKAIAKGSPVTTSIGVVRSADFVSRDGQSPNSGAIAIHSTDNVVIQSMLGLPREACGALGSLERRPGRADVLLAFRSCARHLMAVCTLAIAPGIAVYIDSTRVERTRPDTSVGAWLLWIGDTFIPADTTPMAGHIKKIIVHAAIRCSERRVRALELDVYDSSGTLVARHAFKAGDSLRPLYDQMVDNVWPAVCAWLRDPTTPAVTVP